MDPRPPLSFDFTFDAGMTKPSRATFKVEWGYEVHSITLTERNWNRVRRGKPVCIRGNGYYYDGEFFWDFWTFNRPEGELTVGYGDGGEGWNGPWEDALEGLEAYSKKPSIKPKQPARPGRSKRT